MSLVPPAVVRAERLLLNNHEVLHSDQEYESALRVLLEFHQDVVGPICAAFAFAIPCSKALRAIARHAPDGVLEVGAGNGLWAAMLREAMPVEASDRGNTAFHTLEFVWDAGVRVVDATAAVVPPPALPPAKDVRSQVLILRGEAIPPQQEEKRALLMVWPPLEQEQGRSRSGSAQRNSMAMDALRGYIGDTLLYVGEWRERTGLLAALSPLTAETGHTAGCEFQRVVDREWRLVESVALPRWPGLADRLYIFKRRELEEEQGGDGDKEPHTARARLPQVPPFPGARAAFAARGPPPAPKLRMPSLGERLRGLTSLGATQSAVVASVVLLDDFVRSQPERVRAREARELAQVQALADAEMREAYRLRGGDEQGSCNIA